MKKLTPLKAARKFCLECLGGSTKEVAECSGNLEPCYCPLWIYRFGKNPNRKGLGNPNNFRESDKPGSLNK